MRATLLLLTLWTVAWDANPITEDVTGYRLWIWRGAAESPIVTDVGNTTQAAVDLQPGDAVQVLAYKPDPNVGGAFLVSAPSARVTVPTPPMPSPDETQIPPEAQIVDTGGGVWTFGAIVPEGRIILRNGQQAAGGIGDTLLWRAGTLYAKAVGVWYAWGGMTWTTIGPTLPGAPPPPLDCGPDATGKRAVQLAVGDWTRTAHPKDSGRVLFSLTRSRHPVRLVIVTLNGIEQPGSRQTGDDLRRAAGIYFDVPAVGTYAVRVSANDALDGAGCEDGAARPMTLVVTP